MFGTLQNPAEAGSQELRLRGITDLEKANCFLRTEYLHEHNRRFTVPAEEKGSAFVPFVGPGLKEILCLKEERTVGNDNSVRYKGLSLQIPQDQHRYHYVRDQVRVHEYHDGSLAVFHGPRKLADYSPSGELILQKIKECAA
ncbi:MAG: hypothetical protein AB1641_13175 [Thermodesulfobacteriota bacterium]